MTSVKAATQVSNLRLVRFAVAMAFAATVAGCAPQQAERMYSQPQTQFGPLQQDTDLGLEGPREMSSIDPAKLRWEGEVDSASVFNAAEELIDLGHVSGRPVLGNLGERLGDAFYAAAPNTTRATLEESPYISAAIGETKADALKTAKESDRMLAEQSALVMRILDETGARYPWPQGALKPEYLIDAAQIYTEIFLEQLDRSPVDPRIRSAIHAAAQEKIFKRLDDVRRDAAVVLAEANGIIVIFRLRELLDKYDVKLDRATRSQLDKVERTLRSAQRIEDAQDALSVIVDLWKLTDPSAREATFKPISPELYDYLDGKSPAGLACLQSLDCSDLLIVLAKKVKILPALRSYGIPKIRERILRATRDGVVNQFEAQASQLLPGLPRMIGEEFLSEIGSLRSLLRSVESDFDGFVRSLAARAADSLLATPAGVELRGVEASRVRVDLEGGRGLEIAPVRSGAVVTGAETIGASFAFAAKTLSGSEADADLPEFRKKAIEQINKMLAIGGFRDGHGIAFSSFARSIDPSKNLHLDLRHFLEGEESFAVPDRLIVSEAFHQNESGDVQVSARSQAEMLHGLSLLVSFFRDWESNAFDRHLGSLTVEDYVPQLPKGSIAQSLFPKDIVFSLAVGNAAVILQNLTRKLSPVFVINLERRAVWANEFDLSEGNPATMAALVDIDQGLRADWVHSTDVARFLVSIADFLQATEGIENTKAKALIEPGVDGKRPVDTLISARDRMRLLLVGLANFLSHQMQDKDGGIRARFNRLSGETQATEPRRLLDQALTIRALLTAGRVLNMDIYRWAALDAYAFMNRTLFNHELGFYQAIEGSGQAPDFRTLVATLLAGEELKNQMTEKSRLQWERISSDWLSALERF